MENAQKIKLLPPEISNKIAAGEVVERPSSVVKELVENAIDAGATEITIVLKNGGRELIQVIDNGAGMGEADLRLAFQRHATSKIWEAADLQAIATLGFRGEALASIASVARVEAKSIPAGAISGMQLMLEGGKLTQEAPAGGTQGTSITVKNLFFNTPARLKFLRADSTEYRHCLMTANRFALCYPDIAFTLVHNGEVIWDVHKQSQHERICKILGKRVGPMLIGLSDDRGMLQVDGFLGNQDTVRRRSGEQYLFLNGRYIQDRSLNHAIVSAYGEILAHGGYPLYVLHLKIDVGRVDVNVHPTKMEVKFADDRLVYSLLRGAVRKALISAKVVPELGRNFGRQGGEMPAGRGSGQLPPRPMPGHVLTGSATSGRMPIPKHEIYAPPQQPDTGSGQAQLDLRPADAAPEGMGISGPGEGRPDTTPQQKPNVWQIHKRYILTQLDSGLAIIDQHVAHERVLYEKALAMFEQAKPVTQKLLFPYLIELSVEDYDILQEVNPFLRKLGFLINDFGQNTAVLEGVPAGLKIKNYNSIIQEILDDYKRGKREKLEIRDNVAKSFACHTAIRSGEALTVEEMNALLTQLFATETPYFCPHGRPVIVNISLDELDKRFGRI